MALSLTSVLKLYNTVIDDVISGVRDAFLDEGVDEQVLQELKQIWTNKLLASRAVELVPDNPDPQPPPNVANSAKSGSSSKSNHKNMQSNGTKSKASRPSQQQQLTQVKEENGSPPATTLSQTFVTQNGGAPQKAPVAPTTTAAATSQPQQTTTSVVAGLDPNKLIPVQITLPAQAGVANSEPRVLTIHMPASALQENQLHQMLNGPIISSIMSLPPPIASSVLQQHVNSTLQNQLGTISIQKQLDGAADTSDEDGTDVSDDDNIDGDDDDPDNDPDDADGEGGAEEEPLNSEDDVTDEDAADLFDTDNVVVCQYDKITRSRNKWKFYLKDGIMNIGGKDYVFQKSNGDAEW
ncbi:transcription initiation factor IIA subunit 1 [Phlebotomus argentipes]|uniref:transcription initiation factor IIA subunit 1 n=1 Tax=Phlebotomus argentipes TaxID=94469 RepID=UPI002892D342|nr:transcription initiation factor IIA subunit 1 [Phlebotomus argentipes]